MRHDVGTNEVEVTIVREDQSWKYPGQISDELKEMLMKELEFGVNLPDTQDYELTTRITMRHTV
jgi:hypothetical protein